MTNKSEKREILSKALGKVKMHNAGDKHTNRDVPVRSESKESHIYYPSLYLDSKQAPFLANSDIEDKVTLVVKGEITSHSLNENGKSKRESFDIKIKEIGMLEK